MEDKGSTYVDELVSANTMVGAVAKMIQEGKTVAEIAKAINVHYGYTHVVVRLLKGNKKYRAALELLRSGLSIQEVAERLGYKVATVHYLRKAFLRFGLVHRGKGQKCVELQTVLGEIVGVLSEGGCTSIKQLSAKLGLSMTCTKKLLRELLASSPYVKEHHKLRIDVVKRHFTFLKYVKMVEEDVKKKGFSDISGLDSKYRRQLIDYATRLGLKVLKLARRALFSKRLRKDLVLVYREGYEEAVAGYIVEQAKPCKVISIRQLLSIRYRLREKWLRTDGDYEKIIDAIIRKL